MYINLCIIIPTPSHPIPHPNAELILPTQGQAHVTLKACDATTLDPDRLSQIDRTYHTDRHHRQHPGTHIGYRALLQGTVSG